MKCISMGLNTEPCFNVDETIKRFRDQSNEEMVEYWKKQREYALSLRESIIKAVEEEGEVALSWSCEGRTRHQMHAMQWSDAMPEYEFEIGYNYHCVVRKKSNHGV